MEMRPKIVTNGANPLNTRVPILEKVYMPDQINFNLSVHWTDIV